MALLYYVEAVAAGIIEPIHWPTGYPLADKCVRAFTPMLLFALSSSKRKAKVLYLKIVGYNLLQCLHWGRFAAKGSRLQMKTNQPASASKLG